MDIDSSIMFEGCDVGMVGAGEQSVPSDSCLVTDVEIVEVLIGRLIEARFGIPAGVLDIACLSAQFGLNGQACSVEQLDNDVALTPVLHRMNGQLSDVEGASESANASKYNVGKSGLFHAGFYVCADVCDEICVGIPCENKTCRL